MDGTQQPRGGASTDGEWPSPGQGWWAMVVFCVALMFAQLDQGIINLLVAPMKRDLGLNDFDISLLSGVAFSIFYAFIGLPLSRYVDTKSRKHILTAGIAIWSVATACCGVAQNFAQLFLARVMVGAGESINGPATYSMIADFFPREKLARPFAVLQIGFLSGQGFSMLIGAFLIQMLVGVPDVSLPILGTVHNWQLVFVFIGLPGVLVALAMLTTVREPPRHGDPTRGDRPALPMRTVVKYLVEHKAVFGPMFVGLGFSAMNLFGVIFWTPSFFLRTYGWSIPRAGLYLGISSLVASSLGLIVGTWLNQYYVRQGRDDANLRVVVLAQFIRVPAAILAPIMPDPFLSLLMSGLVSFAGFLGAPSQNAALQIITPSEMRGQVTALYLFMFSVVGSGLGPSVVGAITDYVMPSESMLNYSLFLFSGVLGPISAFVIWTGLKPYTQTVTRLRMAGA